MTIERARPRHRLAEALGSLSGNGTFTARRLAPIDDLRIEVRGVGPLKLPLKAAQARELRVIARPARYGRGEETLLDRRVRDTWELPRSRVRIDKRRWNKTLLPMVEALGQDLGIPPGRRLTAELHSVLLYEAGQFFAPHKDSEKADGMIASLVVVLPSNATGGELVVEHRGQQVLHDSSRTKLACVAFYADTVHEILPVESGWRMALTYNLSLAPHRPADTDGNASAFDPALVDNDALVEDVATLLDRHFNEPSDAPSWRRYRSAAGAPDRLVYLLDHDYTERGMSWDRLKGDDAARAAILRAAAERASCDTTLALAHVHEIWDCIEEPWGSRGDPWGRGRWGGSRWGGSPSRGPVSDLDDYELGELIDSDVSLAAPTSDSDDEDHAPAEPDELCATTPSIDLEADESHYEGFTGNAGSTMDRWY